MLERYLVEHCSPTLASIKTANLFTFTYQSEEELLSYIEDWNLKFQEKGVSIAILRNRNHKATTSAEMGFLSFCLVKVTKNLQPAMALKS